MQYVLPLMAISSLISQSLVDFFLIVVGCQWLYFFLKARSREEFLPKTGLEWPFLGLFLAMLLSILVNYWGRWEFLWPVHKIKWVFEFYAILWFLKKYGFDAEKSFKSILVVGLIPSIYAIATFFRGVDYLNPERATADRVVGLVNSATYHAHAGAILVGFVLFLFIDLGIYKRKYNWFYLACIFTAGMSFYLTYTRGAYLALLVGLLSYSFSKGKRFFWISMSVLAIASSIAYIVSPQLRARVEQTIVPEKMDRSRIGLFKSYSEVFNDNRVFGSGYDAYKKDGSLVPYTSKNGVSPDLQTSHAHNQYLQMAATTGILGLVFFSWILLVVFRKLKFNSSGFSGANLSSTLGPVYLIILSLMVTDQTFEYARIRVVIILFFALIILFERSSLEQVGNEDFKKT